MSRLINSKIETSVPKIGFFGTHPMKSIIVENSRRNLVFVPRFGPSREVAEDEVFLGSKLESVFQVASKRRRKFSSSSVPKKKGVFAEQNRLFLSDQESSPGQTAPNDVSILGLGPCQTRPPPVPPFRRYPENDPFLCISGSKIGTRVPFDKNRSHFATRSRRGLRLWRPPLQKV